MVMSVYLPPSGGLIRVETVGANGTSSWSTVPTVVPMHDYSYGGSYS